MKQTTLSIKTFILLILFILPCVSSASEKPAPEGIKQGPEIFVQLGHNFCGKIVSVALLSIKDYTAMSKEGC